MRFFSPSPDSSANNLRKSCDEGRSGMIERGWIERVAVCTMAHAERSALLPRARKRTQGTLAKRKRHPVRRGRGKLAMGKPFTNNQHRHTHRSQEHWSRKGEHVSERKAQGGDESRVGGDFIRIEFLARRVWDKERGTKKDTEPKGKRNTAASPTLSRRADNTSGLEPIEWGARARRSDQGFMTTTIGRRPPETRPQ